MKIYLENLDIKYVRSALYYPQTNGWCEVLHKQMKKFLIEDFKNNKENFDIDIAIVNAIESHNSIQHTIAKYEPNYLRNKNDKEIIEEVVKIVVKILSNLWKEKLLNIKNAQ